MAKGYWVGRVDVSDSEGYKEYFAAAAPVFAEYGAQFLIRGGSFDPVEGSSRERNVLIEFPSYEVALACYRSPGYQRARAVRERISVADIIVIEGYDGPQPQR